jgi:hypothetical protein
MKKNLDKFLYFLSMSQPVDNESWRVLAGMLATLQAVPLSPSPSSAHHHLRLPSLERRVNNVKERWQILSVYLTSKNVLKQVLGIL